MIPGRLPEDIRRTYENSYSDWSDADLPKRNPSKENLRGILVRLT